MKLLFPGHTIGTHLICSLLLCWIRISVANSPFSSQILANGLYKVTHDGSAWMDAGSYWFQAEGKKWSLADQTLKAVVPPVSSKGQDKLGTWVMLNFTWAAGSSRIDTTFKMYDSKIDSGLQFIIFSQNFRDGLKNTSVGDANKLISAFPSTNVQSGLGMLIYADLMSGWVKLDITRWKSGHSHLPDGLLSGPIILFDTKGSAMVISAFNHFMVANVLHDVSTNTLNWGIMGSIDSIPAGYTMDTIVYYSDKGINDAVAGWGRIMRQYYGKDSMLRYEDPTIKYIGYWTDNGAFYYHNTELGKNYEQSMLDSLSYASQKGIPYRYIQYDDWWYYITQHEGYGATLNWEPMPSVFPNGLVYMYNKTRMGVHAHNRYWSNRTVYAKQNGGQFDFVISKDKALPIQQEFWDFLFSRAVQWGLMVYEQDWLNFQSEYIEQLQTDLFLGEKWLKQMGEAASRYGLRVQYCMALPRHVLTALEIPTVTQARVSNDYVKTNQWKIGISSIFVDALGIAPFKDNFWSTTNETGNPYKGKTEPYPLRQAIVAVLSTGPVGPSDGVGFSDPQILNTIYRADGLILKPSKPATAIDAQLLQAAFGGTVGPVGEVWTTYSKIGQYTMGIIFASEMNNSFAIKPSHTGFMNESEVLLYSHETVRMNIMPTIFSQSHPLSLKSCSAGKWCLNFTTTAFHIGSEKVALLGEMSKIVPLSPYRTEAISVSDIDVQVTLIGIPGEKLDFSIYYENPIAKMIKNIPCVFTDDGTVVVSASKMTCQ